MLPLFKRRTEEVGQLLPELYLHGLSLGDFDLSLRGLLGNGAPLSPGSIERLKACWKAEYEAWKGRPLAELDVVYLWVDGIYVKAGLEKDKATLLVAVAALRDGSKVVLAVESGHRESVESWSTILRDLKSRRLNCPRLAVGDGHLGIWGALANVFPDTREQRCWNHHIVNIMDKLPKKKLAEARPLLTSIPYAETREEAEEGKAVFRRWCDKNGCSAGTLETPAQHQHNRIAVCDRETADYSNVENATAVIWKTLMTAQKSFRKLNAQELMADVADGATYINGVMAKKVEMEIAA